eukprot:4897351-Alexandrium_andersonii.AAC.1
MNGTRGSSRAICGSSRSGTWWRGRLGKPAKNLHLDGAKDPARRSFLRGHRLPPPTFEPAGPAPATPAAPALPGGGSAAAPMSPEAQDLLDQRARLGLVATDY